MAGKVVWGQVAEKFPWLVTILRDDGKTLKGVKEGSGLVKKGLQKDWADNSIRWIDGEKCKEGRTLGEAALA